MEGIGEDGQKLIMSAFSTRDTGGLLSNTSFPLSKTQLYNVEVPSSQSSFSLWFSLLPYPVISCLCSSWLQYWDFSLGYGSGK